MCVDVRVRRDARVCRLLIGLLCACASACASACVDSDVDVAVPGDDARLALTGAAELDHDDGARLRFSSAGLTLRFTGRVRLLIDDDGTSADASSDGWADEDGGNRFALTIGDREVAVPAGPIRDVVVESDLASGAQTLTLVKKTEALFGAARVVAVVVEQGSLLPPAAGQTTKPTLLVVGDSWATGFGVLGDLPVPTSGTPGGAAKAPGPRCPFTPDTQDVRRAWPAVVGDALGRDVAVVGWSGRGMLRDYDGDERPASLPAILRTALLANPPDDVVIALGHNDAWSGLPDEARFRAATRALVDDVTDVAAADAAVVVIAPLFDDPAPARDRTGPLRAWLQVPGVVVIDEPAIDDTLGFGCVWHPGTRRQHDLAMKTLLPLKAALEARTHAR